MRGLWRRFRAWRAAKHKRYSEHWTETKPYDGRADKYLPPTSPETFPPSGGGGL